MTTVTQVTETETAQPVTAVHALGIALETENALPIRVKHGDDLYSPQYWADEPSGGTPLDAAALTHMEMGIFTADSRVPAGGSTNDLLAKATDDDRSLKWVSPAAAPLYRHADWVVATTGQNRGTLGGVTDLDHLEVFKNGVLLRGAVDYTVSDAEVSFTSALTSGDVVSFQYWSVTASVAAASLTTYDASNPAIRDYALTPVINSAAVVAEMPSCVSGDLLILFVAHGWGNTLPSGYTNRDSSTGSGTNGRVATKTATTGDATSTTLTITFDDAYYGEVGIISVINPGVIREVKASRMTDSNESVVVTTTSTAVSTDLAVYLGFGRADNEVVTFGRGVILAQRTFDVAGGISLGRELISSSGTISQTFTHEPVPGGAGTYDAVIVIEHT